MNWNTFYDACKLIVAAVVAAVVALSAVVQFSPIKINPWSWMARCIGKALNADLVSHVEALDKKVDKLSSEYHEGKAMNARVQILRFGDEILQGHQCTKGHYDEILRSIKYYKEYCDDHPEFENGVTGPSAECIERKYRELWNSNGFLKDGDWK